MAIGPSNSLTFIGGSLPPVAGRVADAKADTARDAARTGTSADAIPVLQDSTPEQETAGVVLSLQSDPAGEVSASPAKDLVYTATAKAAPSPSSDTDSDASVERMALQHNQALERSAGSSTRLSLDANGVLLATPASPQERKAQEFVHHAVHTMRAYADEQDRLKNLKKDSGTGADAAALIPRSLADVQKLAARFKLFA